MKAKRSFWFIFLLLSAGIIASLITFKQNPYNTAADTFRGRVLGFELFRIPSHSMEPTLQPGDYIYVSTSAYQDEAPEVNDVVTFLYPKDRSINYIKRLIGGPGDRVKIIDFQVYVNGQKIEQPYITEGLAQKDFSEGMSEITIPEGKFFALGDNRDNSNDSRFFGAVDQTDIIGKATRIIFGKNHRTGTAIQ